MAHLCSALIVQDATCVGRVRGFIGDRMNRLGNPARGHDLEESLVGVHDSSAGDCDDRDDE